MTSDYQSDYAAAQRSTIKRKDDQTRPRAMRNYRTPHLVVKHNWLMMSDSAREYSVTDRRTVLLCCALFFASGFAAILYQVAWQRALFGWYGVDLDSVSIIVSVFMLGLGTGALFGGWLADRFQRSRIHKFVFIEMTMATFGIFSLDVIDNIGAVFAANSIPSLVLLSFGVLIVPTCAMGATLPLLVTELVDLTDNVGFSTGALYFINTFGAATGAFTSGLFLLSFSGLDGLVMTAVILNLSVAAFAFLMVRRT